MTRRSLALIGAVLTAGALVAIPTAAVGHTDSLYSWGYTADGDAPSAFLSMSKADAALASLADLPGSVGHIVGTEVCNDIGYAVDGEERTVITWDHATGELIESAALSADGFVSFADIDALADCTLLALAFSTQDDAWVILEVDPATGATAVELELSDIAGLEDYYTGIATAPDGTTWAFGVVDGGPWASEIDLETGVQEFQIWLTGLWDSVDQHSTFTAGVDFDDSGRLWFIQGFDERLQLRSLPAGADIYIDAPDIVGEVPWEPTVEPFVDFPTPLAVDHAAPAPVPQLGATGAGLPIGVVIAAAILLLGGAAILARRAM